MADDVKVPGIKQPVPKWMVGVGLGGVGVAIILYYRSKKAASTTTAAPTSTDQYPPDGTVGNPSDPYSTDPATGQTYGDEAVGSGGTFGAFGGLGSGLGGSGTGWDPNTGLYTDPNGNTCTNPDGNGFCPGTGSGGPPFSNNTDWAAFAEQQLANDSGIDPGALAEALGLYLAGQPVDAAQKTLIFQAQGVAGPVPVAGPNGFPPNIQTNGSGGGNNATNPVTGLKQTGQEGFTGADISWNKSTNATSYTVTSDKGTVSTSGTTARIHDIAPKNSQATVSVLANPAAAGAVPAKIVVKVKGKADAGITPPPKPKR